LTTTIIAYSSKKRSGRRRCLRHAGLGIRLWQDLDPVRIHHLVARRDPHILVDQTRPELLGVARLDDLGQPDAARYHGALAGHRVVIRLAAGLYRRQLIASAERPPPGIVYLAGVAVNPDTPRA